MGAGADKVDLHFQVIGKYKMGAFRSSRPPSIRLPSALSSLLVPQQLLTQIKEYVIPHKNYPTEGVRLEIEALQRYNNAYRPTH